MSHGESAFAQESRGQDVVQTRPARRTLIARLKPVKLVGMPRAVLVFEHSAVPMTKPVSVEQSKSEGV